MGIFRTSSPGDSISNDSERTTLRRRGEKPGYIEVLQQRAGSLNIKRNAGLDEAQARIKIARRNINNLRYADDTTLWQKVRKN